MKPDVFKMYCPVCKQPTEAQMIAVVVGEEYIVCKRCGYRKYLREKASLKEELNVI